MSGVIDWFLGRAGDRRQYKRKAGSFHLWWRKTGVEKPLPGMGIEISPNGLVFLHPARVPDGEQNLVFDLNEKRINARVKVLRADQLAHNGKTWNRHMCEFTGIAADDWDRIVRYVNDEADVPDRRQMQNQEMSKPDDAYRLLPLAVQQKIVAALVETNRLDKPHPGQAPLMKLFYGGLTKDAEGKKVHRVNVHSRKAAKDEMLAYDTRFLVDDDGQVRLA